MNKKSLRQMFIDLDLHPDEEVLTTFTVYGHLSSRLGLWPWSVSEKVRYELSRRDKLEMMIENCLDIPAHPDRGVTATNIMVSSGIAILRNRERLHELACARTVHCSVCGAAHISGSMCPMCYSLKK